MELREIGKAISAASRAKIEAAIGALQDLLGGDQQATTESRRRLLLEAAELSFSDKENAVRDAIRAKFVPAGQKGIWAYVTDVYDDYAIASVDQETPPAGVVTRLYRVPYGMVDGAVTLGEPTEVRRVVTYEPVTAPTSESADVELTGDLVPLVEKAVGTKGTVAVKVIQPGWGSSGYYPAETLKRDGPKVFTKGLHMHVDHPTAAEEAERPERSVNTLGAVLESDARWEDSGPAGPGLYAEAKPLGAFKERLPELAPHIGVSIRALGKASSGEAEGRQGRIVEAITAAKSIDFVTTPGAGGQVLQLFEAARGGQANSREEVHEVDESEAQALREANAAAEAEIKRLKEALLAREANDFVVASLAKVEMPASTRQRLTESLAAKPALKDGALDKDAFKTAIEEGAKAELAYLAQATGAGKIVGLGSTGSDAGATDGLKESFKAMYLRQGRTAEEAEKLAAFAAEGR